MSSPYANYPYLRCKIEREPEFEKKLKEGYQQRLENHKKGMAPKYTWEDYLRSEEWQEIAKVKPYSWQRACH